MPSSNETACFTAPQEIVVGFRTPAGQITTTQSFKTVQLPRLVRGKPGAWDPQICFSWAQQFLTTLKSTLSAPPEPTEAPSGEGSPPSEPSARVWRIVLAPGEGAKVSLLDEVGVKEVEAGEERVGILPRWFYDQVVGKNLEASAVASVPSQPAVAQSGASAPTSASHLGWNI